MGYSDKRNTMNLGKFPEICWKRKFRWYFLIPDICDDGVDALIATKSARPHFAFKEAEIQHLSEIIYAPMKAEFKPLNLTLYDFKKEKHPIFEWIKRMYDVNDRDVRWKAPSDKCVNPGKYNIVSKTEKCFKIQTAILTLLDGCGNSQETWYFENLWPQEIDFGDLDYSSSDIITVQLTLRFDRAYPDFSAEIFKNF